MSKRREPETSLFVLIARRMEPERSGSLSQRPLGQAPGWPFAISGLSSCLVQGTAERPASGDRRVTSCTQAERDPLVEQVGHSIDFRAH